MRAGWGALTLVLATGAPLRAAVPEANGRSLAEIAESYRAGNRATAVAAVALLSRESVERDVERLASFFSAAGEAGTGKRRAAIMLLSERALLDLHDETFPRVRWELEGAARLVDAGPLATRRSRFDRRFYLLAALALHAGGHLEPGHDLLRKALKSAGEDPELLTAQGAISESVAALRTYDPSPDSPRRPGRPGGYASEHGESGSLTGASLADAEVLYQRALAVDPDLAEARLRLGRVLLLRGRPVEAQRTLEQVAREARQPGHRYLARLFAGRALEVRDDVDGAAAAFLAATEQEPQAQTALLALGRALGRLGDTAGSQEALLRASSRGRSEDPWWDYQSGQPARLHELLDELRRLAP